MPAKSIFSDLQKSFIAEAYVQKLQQPAVVIFGLNQKFSTEFTISQVQRYINNNLTARRKKVEAKHDAYLAKSETQIARDLAGKHVLLMTRFAEKSALGADKALDMVVAAKDPRTMQSAAAAAKSLISSFRICAGIDGPGSAPKGSTFNFNFANIPAIPLTAQVAAAVEVAVTEVESEDDEDEDDAEVE